MNKTHIDGFLRATASTTHPLQTVLDFVFTDFGPNKNKQGVPESEADNVIRTGLFMPVKANFAGQEIRSHVGSVPIGPITEMRRDGDRILGRAVLWNDEFSALATHLKSTSAASSDGIQFSWELYHGGSETDDEGTLWLKDIMVAGITIVADPAYGGRTPLLSIASNIEERLEKLEQRIEELVAQERRSLSMAENEEQQDNGTAADAVTLSKSEFDALNAKVSELTTELEGLREFKQQVEQEKVQAELVAKRKTELAETLSDEEFDARQDFIIGLSEDQFVAYKDSLVQALTRAKSSASKQNDDKSLVPDPVSGNGRSQDTVDMTELVNALRGYHS